MIVEYHLTPEEWEAYKQWVNEDDGTQYYYELLRVQVGIKTSWDSIPEEYCKQGFQDYRVYYNGSIVLDDDPNDNVVFCTSGWRLQ